MKFSFFESLTGDEAQEFLDEFLRFGKERSIAILEDNLHFTIDLDFSLASLPNVLKSLIPKLKTLPRDPDPKVPEFIRNSDLYTKGLFDFDEPSKSIVLSAGYYLGETFVRNFEKLSWGIGNTDYAEGNMPVVTGFKFNIEMAPILIVENMFSGVISGIKPESSIDKAVEVWSSNFF